MCAHHDEIGVKLFRCLSDHFRCMARAHQHLRRGPTNGTECSDRLSDTFFGVTNFICDHRGRLVVIDHVQNDELRSLTPCELRRPVHTALAPLRQIRCRKDCTVMNPAFSLNPTVSQCSMLQIEARVNGQRCMQRRKHRKQAKKSPTDPFDPEFDFRFSHPAAPFTKNRRPPEAIVVLRGRRAAAARIAHP